ncbi:MAG: hypothetical protein F6K40_17495 [Okeania sp. SIO3I5]|uniref:hypothetical protein n=1 Tax=Okeania sp. SIO3I5 TaxID=2607805 RepID=UPI0013BB0A20|nr:hypothetical protein [Okeania sp. SIO3I5]NEQ37960.1 hypothetical protein [Okeania sp. SIO3I5]
MTRISPKLVRLERRLRAAQARKEYKDAELQRRIEQQVTTAYESRGILTTYYVPSITDPENLYIQVSVPETSLREILGGVEQTDLDKIGGFLVILTGKAYAQQRGFADKYMSIKVVQSFHRA